MAPNPLDRLVQWFKLRCEESAKASEAYKWAKSLPKEQVEALMESAPLHDDYYTDTGGWTKEDVEFVRTHCFDLANKWCPEESIERRKALGAHMHFLHRMRWQTMGGREFHARAMAQDQERRAAYKADYAQRLDAAAAADPTTMENRRAHAQQAFQNTGKYLTNTGRELTQDERSQMGLPRSR